MKQFAPPTIEDEWALDEFLARKREQRLKNHKPELRPAKVPSLEQRLKMAARAYANAYRRRGELRQVPCRCGNPNSEMHHADYKKPLDVIWLCRKCHRAEDRAKRASSIG